MHSYVCGGYYYNTSILKENGQKLIRLAEKFPCADKMVECINSTGIAYTVTLIWYLIYV